MGRITKPGAAYNDFLLAFEACYTLFSITNIGNNCPTGIALP
jgi:hypothetical protein